MKADKMDQRSKQTQEVPIWQEDGFPSRHEWAAAVVAETEAAAEAGRLAGLEESRGDVRKPPLPIWQQDGFASRDEWAAAVVCDAERMREAIRLTEDWFGLVRCLDQAMEAKTEKYRRQNPDLTVLNESVDYLEDLASGLARLQPALPDEELEPATEQVRAAVRALRGICAAYAKMHDEKGSSE